MLAIIATIEIDGRFSGEDVQRAARFAHARASCAAP